MNECFGRMVGVPIRRCTPAISRIALVHPIPAPRPPEASKVAIRYVRNTSVPALRSASTDRMANALNKSEPCFARHALANRLA